MAEEQQKREARKAKRCWGDGSGPATERQLRYIYGLLTDEYTSEEYEVVALAKRMSSAQAGRIIDVMKRKKPGHEKASEKLIAVMREAGWQEEGRPTWKQAGEFLLEAYGLWKAETAEAEHESQEEYAEWEEMELRRSMEEVTSRLV